MTHSLAWMARPLAAAFLALALALRSVTAQPAVLGVNADHLDSFPDFERQMRGWLDAGQLRALGTIVDGLDQAATAFAGLFEGYDTGKLVVRLSE